jgi:hypothetical protein
VVTICTTSSNREIICVLPTMRLCVLCGSQNKQRLFIFSVLSYRFFYNRGRECLLRGTDYIYRYSFVLKGLTNRWIFKSKTATSDPPDMVQWCKLCCSWLRNWGKISKYNFIKINNTSQVLYAVSMSVNNILNRKRDVTHILKVLIRRNSGFHGKRATTRKQVAINTITLQAVGNGRRDGRDCVT